MTRARCWLHRALLAIAIAGLGCMKAQAPARLLSPSKTFQDTARRPGVPAVMVFLAASSHTKEAWKALKDELEADFDVITRVVPPEATEAALASELAAVRPDCIVLMGNLPLNLYQKFQSRRRGPFPPAVAVMASFFEEQRPLFKNTTGVAYEIPGVTTFVQLRSFSYRPIRRVGVLYRPMFTRYVEKQRELASLEEVQVVGLEVSEVPGPYEVRRALDRLIRRERIDAIWVLNDNVLLKPELIAKGWLKILHKRPTAVVVGVGSLVDPRLHFGSFAMLPDHAALGMQAANMVFKLAEEDWNARDVPVELPLSVKSVVDLSWTREHFELRDDALEYIDRVVQ